ncbi:9148_t:CDS:1, partial [Gigaspora rosea]
RHDTRPLHQQQFTKLLNNAMERFKEQNGAYILNKTNRDQIFDLFRKKLAVDFWTNEEFTNLDSYKIAQYTLYLAGFAKNKNFPRIRGSMKINR